MEKFEFTPRTCEEYVLSNLLKAKEDCKKLMDDNIKMALDVIKQNHVLATLRKYAKLRQASDNSWIISFDLIFEEFEKDDFEIVCEMLGLEKPESEKQGEEAKGED